MLHSQVQQSGINLHYLGYTNYDGYGNLAQQTNHVLTSLGGATEDYTYDKLHRLTQSNITLSGVTSSIDYAYDAVGKWPVGKTSWAKGLRAKNSQAKDCQPFKSSNFVAICGLMPVLLRELTLNKLS